MDIQHSAPEGVGPEGAPRARKRRGCADPRLRHVEGRHEPRFWSCRKCEYCRRFDAMKHRARLTAEFNASASVPLAVHLTFRNDDEATPEFFRTAWHAMRNGLRRKGEAFPLRKDADGNPVMSRLRGGEAYRFRSDRTVEQPGCSIRYHLRRENGEKRGRFHAHLLLMTDCADFEPGRIPFLWRHGRCKVAPIHPTRHNGYAGIAKYLSEYLGKDDEHRVMQSQGFGRSWNTVGLVTVHRA